VSAIVKRPALGAFGAWVGDPATGAVLYESKATTPLLPASTLKLLTAVTALKVLTPTHRIATRVVVDGSTITLIGGGDAMLASSGPGASLASLADQVATQVQGSPVTLNYDTSLFSGRTLAAGWKKSFPAAGVAAPVQALMVDQGRTNPRGNSRVSDPAEYAMQLFAKALRNSGVKVNLGVRAKAPAGATQIAKVESVPVQQLVNHMLTDSDNDLAECLAHLSGVAQLGTGTFASGAAAMKSAASELGIPVQGMQLFDGSGLSSKNRVSAQALGKILVLSANGSFDGIASALAVAGFTGTLADRFLSGPQKVAAGFVRAKTGTLSSGVALAGIVPDIAGRVLVFAIIANDIPSIAKARIAVDQFAAKLRLCGCA
jgi:D-alanyl-D-alanine carboxypeptidase/D-alanyl-D-alanine-endopeptidase (penicillin-binding protein 4)